MNLWFYIKSRLKYVFTACHRKGFGVHSPFVFHLLNFVIFEKYPFYAYESIERIRKKMLQNKAVVLLTDYGIGNKQKNCVADIAKCSLETAKFGQLLFRLVNRFNPNNILELGTSLGISTMYLAMPSSKAHVVTIEGSKSLCDIAKQNFKQQGITNVTVVNDNVDNSIDAILLGMPTLDFVYFDANHTKEATLRYFDKCLQKTNKKTIFVFDDIHYSQEMESAWNDIKTNRKVHLSIDLYYFGLAFFNDDLPKQDYVVAF